MESKPLIWRLAELEEAAKPRNIEFNSVREINACIKAWQERKYTGRAVFACIRDEYGRTDETRVAKAREKNGGLQVYWQGVWFDRGWTDVYSAEK